MVKYLHIVRDSATILEESLSMFTRQSYIDALKEILLTSEKQYIAIAWPHWSGKTHLLSLLRGDTGSDQDNIILLDAYDPDLESQLKTIETWDSLVILDSEHGIDTDYFRTFIESYQYDYRYIFTSEEVIDDAGIQNFHLPFVSFREYCEDLDQEIRMEEIIRGDFDLTEIQILKDRYIHLGQLPRHISDPTTIPEDFLSICTDIESELFEKEYESFMEFFRTLAMETGNCFKADKLAKLLGITRRKVNKYMEILLRKGVVRGIWPWVQDMVSETSRHVKIYFTDLSILASLLGDLHAQWAMKLWAIENFTYLELERKLQNTHDIFYYRKKSGSEVTFILEDRATKKITPVEVNTRDSLAISQALKSFDGEYHDRVERYMVMVESLAAKKDLGWIPIFILPHATI